MNNQIKLFLSSEQLEPENKYKFYVNKGDFLPEVQIIMHSAWNLGGLVLFKDGHEITIIRE